MTLIESLKNLGLNEKEAKVYLALLQLGKSTAYNVAVRSGLKKPTTYVILGQLVEKGFVVNVPRAKKQQFVAENPEKCLAMAREKIELTKKELPELLALQKKQEAKVGVSYFEGLPGVRESYKRFFKAITNKPIEKRNFVAFYAKTDNLEAPIEEVFDEFNENFRRYNIHRRGITTHNNLIAQKYLSKVALEKYNTTIKAIDETKYSSYISIEIFDNLIHIISQRNYQSIIIEDKDIADVMRQIFELVWELVDKDRQNLVRFSSLDSNA